MLINRRGSDITKVIDDKKILELHEQGMLHKEIAAELGYGVSTVTHHLLHMGIRERRTNKDEMVNLHLKGFSDAEIAEMLGCTRSNVTIQLNHLGYTNRKVKKDNIELRERISQSLIGRYVGKDNPNYRGRSDEKTLARGILSAVSRRLIRNSDHTCEHCKKYSDRLEIHHIKPFKIILDEFLNNVYDGNIDTFYKQITSYPDFTDETNIVILCRDCHMKTHYTDDPELSPYRWESATTIESTSGDGSE